MSKDLAEPLLQQVQVASVQGSCLTSVLAESRAFGVIADRWKLGRLATTSLWRFYGLAFGPLPEVMKLTAHDHAYCGIGYLHRRFHRRLRLGCRDL